jgi:deoxyribodipyrimidine photo-lyase
MPAPSTASVTPGNRSAARPSERPIELVWLKRDLRLRDHAPLAEAAARGPVLCLYVYEPELMAHTTTHASHLEFVNASLRELDGLLRERGGSLITRVGNLPDVFDELHAGQPIARLWSHEETGLGITYERDKRVKRWTRERGIEWIELPSHGVFRPLPTATAGPPAGAGAWRRRCARRRSASTA